MNNTQYAGTVQQITRFLRNVDSELSPFVKRVSETIVSIDPKAWSLSGVDVNDMLEFFGLRMLSMNSTKRIKALIESVLREAYSPEEVKKALWNAFKLYAEKIDVVSSNDDEIVFKVVPSEDFNIDQANELLAELTDSELFNVVYNLDNTYTITFYQHGIDNKYKEPAQKIYTTKVRVKMNWQGEANHEVIGNSNLVIHPTDMIEEVLSFNNSSDFELVTTNDGTIVLASAPAEEIEIFYSKIPLGKTFLNSFYEGKFANSLKPMDIVQMQEWAKGTLVKEDSAGVDFQMGTTAFGKPEDTKYNQDAMLQEGHKITTEDLEKIEGFVYGEEVYGEYSSEQLHEVQQWYINEWKNVAEDYGYNIDAYFAQIKDRGDYYTVDEEEIEENQDTMITENDNPNGGSSDAELALIEELAAIEHEQWKGWASALMESEPNISAKRLERWKMYMGPYNGLPNDIKEKDREFARKSLDVLKKYLKRRIAEKNNPPTPGA